MKTLKQQLAKFRRQALTPHRAALRQFIGQTVRVKSGQSYGSLAGKSGTLLSVKHNTCRIDFGDDGVLSADIGFITYPGDKFWGSP